MFPYPGYTGPPSPRPPYCMPVSEMIVHKIHAPAFTRRSGPRERHASFADALLRNCFGWLLPNGHPDSIEAFLKGDSQGITVISPGWIGGGVQR
jgi:hypothetical protein